MLHKGKISNTTTINKVNQNYLVELPGLFCFWYGCTRFAFVSRTLVCGLPWALDATGDNLPANVSNECNILEQVTKRNWIRCLSPASSTLITEARLDWSLHLLSAIRQVTHDARVCVSLFILDNSEAIYWFGVVEMWITVFGERWWCWYSRRRAFVR